MSHSYALYCSRFVNSIEIRLELGNLFVLNTQPSSDIAKKSLGKQREAVEALIQELPKFMLKAVPTDCSECPICLEEFHVGNEVSLFWSNQDEIQGN